MLNWLELRSASSRSLQISEACQRSCPLLVFVPFRRIEDAQVFQPRWTISAAGCPPSRAAFCFSHSCADAILFYVSDLWTYKLTAHNTPPPYTHSRPVLTICLLLLPVLLPARYQQGPCSSMSTLSQRQVGLLHLTHPRRASVPRRGIITACLRR